MVGLALVIVIMVLVPSWASLLSIMEVVIGQVPELATSVTIIAEFSYSTRLLAISKLLF